MMKTYPGLFGKFLDWHRSTEQKASHASIGDYCALEGLTKDQASWLYGCIRRAVNEGMLSDRWWD